MATRNVLSKLGRSERGSGGPPAEFLAMEALDLVDVSLLAATEQGPVDIGRLALTFDHRGLWVRKWTGDVSGHIPWTRLQAFKTDGEPERPGRSERSRGSDKASRADKNDKPTGARARVGLEVRTDCRSHRFVVQHVDPVALEGSITSLSTRYAGRDLVQGEPRKRR